MEVSKSHITSLTLFRNSINYITIICFIIQILFNYSYENILCNVFALITMLLTTNIIFIPRNNNSGAALIGSAIFLIVASNSFFAVIGTLLDGNTLTYTLITPVETYFHRFLFALTLILAFNFSFRTKNNSLKKTFSKLSDRQHLNDLLSTNMVWGLGAFGFFLFLFKLLPLPDVIKKIFDGFGFLIFSPFILLLPIYTKSDQAKNTVWKVAVYYFFIVIISFIANSRQGLVAPAATIFSGWLLLLIGGNVTLDSKLIQKSIIIGALGLFLVGIFSDLSTALLMQRSTRIESTLEEKISGTYKAFLDKKAIEEFKQEQAFISALAKGGSDEWGEDYLRNPFLARFVQIKFDDNLLYRISSYDESAKDKIREVSYNKILVVVPTPVLVFFGSTLDKKYIQSFSMADYMNVLSGSGFLGGLLTGSMTASSYVIFGWWYPIVLFFIYYTLFSVYAGFTTKRKKETNVNNNIASLALIICFQLYINFSIDSVSNLIMLLLRTVWETMFIYHVAIFILRKFNVK